MTKKGASIEEQKMKEVTTRARDIARITIPQMQVSAVAEATGAEAETRKNSPMKTISKGVALEGEVVEVVEDEVEVSVAREEAQLVKQNISLIGSVLAIRRKRLQRKRALHRCRTSMGRR